MNLRKHILSNMKSYFDSRSNKSWIDRYEQSRKNIDHDESWLTLVSMFMLFDDQKSLNERERISSFCKLMNLSGFKKNINIDSIRHISIEKVLPEIMDYKAYLYELLEKGAVHLYPDLNEIMKDRNLRRMAANDEGYSLEGNTNIDVQIEFEYEGKTKLLFIKSNFLSDIDVNTKYNPVRNQIISNIDSMIECVLYNELSFEDVYFAMLSPKVFRTMLYGDKKETLLESFSPTNSRLYCYLMNDYRDKNNLKRDLPHRELKEEDWERIVDRIGWLTFEDIYNCSVKQEAYEHEFKNYFIERNLT